MTDVVKWKQLLKEKNMANAVTLPGDRLAGMTADLMLKLKNGSHTLEELDLFLQRKPLFVPISLRGNAAPIAQAVEELLEDMELVTVSIDPKIDFREVLKTTAKTDKTEALWVDVNFAKVLAEATDPAPASVSMKPYRIKKNARELQIKGVLPKKHEVEATAFVWMLAIELQKVMRGEASTVLAKDRWCLFFMAGFAVYVRWGFHRPKWRVHVWEADGGVWNAESIVFSCS
jgi:hypothetical protein